MRIASKLVCCLDAHRPILRSISWSQDCLILRQFRHIHLQTPALTFDAQSKECQKSDWKRAHKAACVAPATKPSRKPKGDQGARAQARKVDRWFNAWAPAIAWCLPIAMDLANHEWGHHETHAYVAFPPALVVKFMPSDSISTRSLVMAIEHAGISDEGNDGQLFHVRRSHTSPRLRQTYI